MRALHTRGQISGGALPSPLRAVLQYVLRKAFHASQWSDREKPIQITRVQGIHSNFMDMKAGKVDNATTKYPLVPWEQWTGR